ncbi:site-specific integrase [Nocardioides szechwanensis]|uniref:Site-specific recombinase XerD n=1 Tax=Nocardioides szechwanensis TaxID=1005944 RepID=A0A1H0HYT7_9ACTN|nr:tyrosine-type recombinase/integrase [Nocardioides szechwanensis]GEP34324.1 site-specific integrase [Nocardioides szechwanensis]SDO24020.1 Site-specific recombinase XerD [Nocardioides szechwanensis]
MTGKMKDGVIQRGKTFSYVIYEPNTATGKKRQRWVGGFPTRRAAKEARDAARHSVNSGTYVAPQDLTVAAWLDRWMDGHEVELKPSTAKTYRDKIRLYLVPALGHERVQALSPSRLSVAWREMKASGGKDGKPLAPRTVEFARAVLRKAMEDAVVERVITVNPVIGSKMAKRDGKPKHTTWTGTQLAAFLDDVSEDRWTPLWQTLASTGMRRGEVAGLRWDDIDLDAGTIFVGRSTTQLKQERVTTTPKNHERRTVAIDAELGSALRAWRAVTAAERLAFGPGYADRDSTVFLWPDGRPILPDYITKTFARAQATANKNAAARQSGRGSDEPAPVLPKLIVHELRHTHATILLRDKVPVHVVAKRLGHKDPSVTLNVYADVIPDDDTSAVDVFRQAVWGACRWARTRARTPVRLAG